MFLRPGLEHRICKQIFARITYVDCGYMMLVVNQKINTNSSKGDVKKEEK